MSKWQPIETAPRGTCKKVDGPKGDRSVFCPEWCIIAVEPNDLVIQSYWIPESERWNGTSKDKNRVVAWMPWPTYPVSAQ